MWEIRQIFCEAAAHPVKEAKTPYLSSRHIIIRDSGYGGVLYKFFALIGNIMSCTK